MRIKMHEVVRNERYRPPDTTHSETQASKVQNLVAILTVRTYVWIVPNWVLQQSMAKSTGRRVRAVSYVGETQSLLH